MGSSEPNLSSLSSLHPMKQYPEIRRIAGKSRTVSLLSHDEPKQCISITFTPGASNSRRFEAHSELNSALPRAVAPGALKTSILGSSLRPALSIIPLNSFPISSLRRLVKSRRISPSGSSCKPSGIGEILSSVIPIFSAADISPISLRLVPEEHAAVSNGRTRKAKVLINPFIITDFSAEPHPCKAVLKREKRRCPYYYPSDNPEASRIAHYSRTSNT